MQNIFDRITGALETAVEQAARRSARVAGRRDALKKVGGIFMGGAVASSLPFDRSFGAPPEEINGIDDDTACNYWRYCAMDGLLCTTTGGTKTACPVGSEASQVAWVGTCHNPIDEREYFVSYYDCCGKTPYRAGQFCLNSEGERPQYRMGLSNAINWCMANENSGYHYTVAIVVGEAE